MFEDILERKQDRSQEEEEDKDLTLNFTGTMSLNQIKSRALDSLQPPPSSRPSLTLDEKRRAVDLASARVFYHHLYHLNPEVNKEFERVLDRSTEEEEKDTDVVIPGHDNSNYSHFLRPSPVRSGLHSLAHSLCLSFLPAALLRERPPTRVQFFPWLTWDTWYLTLQSAYSLAFPSSSILSSPVPLPSTRRALALRGGGDRKQWEKLARRLWRVKGRRYERMARVVKEGEEQKGEKPDDAPQTDEGAVSHQSSEAAASPLLSKTFPRIQIPRYRFYFLSSSDALDFLREERISRTARLERKHQIAISSVLSPEQREKEQREHEAKMVWLGEEYARREEVARKMGVREEERRRDGGVVDAIEQYMRTTVFPEAHQTLASDAQGNALPITVQVMQQCLSVDRAAALIRQELGDDTPLNAADHASLLHKYLSPPFTINDRPLTLVKLTYTVVSRGKPDASSKSSTAPVETVSIPSGSMKYLLIAEHMTGDEMQRFAMAMEHVRTGQPQVQHRRINFRTVHEKRSTSETWQAFLNRVMYTRPDFWMVIDLGEIQVRCYSSEATFESTVVSLNYHLRQRATSATLIGPARVQQYKVEAVGNADTPLEDVASLRPARLSPAKITIEGALYRQYLRRDRDLSSALANDLESQSDRGGSQMVFEEEDAEEEYEEAEVEELEETPRPGEA
jgi:hypothetical protein